MLVMASQGKPPLFTLSDRTVEKRTVQYSIRMTTSELAALEAEAAQRGITSLNLVRLILAEALAPARASKKRRR